MTEYNNNTGGAPCSYTTLCNYSDSSFGPGKPRPVGGVYVVPTYSAPGYDTLNHNGQGGCGSYFNINSAYGADAGQCNQAYTTSLCGCNAGGNVDAGSMAPMAPVGTMAPMAGTMGGSAAAVEGYRRRFGSRPSGGCSTGRCGRR